MKDNESVKSDVERLKDEYYNSNLQGKLVNKIANKINNDSRNIEVLRSLLPYRNRSIYRSLSYILSELKDSILLSENNLIEEVLLFDDSRIYYDLSDAITLNIGCGEFNKYFYRGLIHKSEFVQNKFFKSIATLNNNQIKCIIDVIGNKSFKKYFSLFLRIDELEKMWFYENLKHHDRLIRKLVFRLMENSTLFLFDEAFELINSLNDEEIFDDFIFSSKFSFELDEL